MRSIHSISSSILLVAVARSSSSIVGAFSNTATRPAGRGAALLATRAIGPGAKTLAKQTEVAAPKKEAAKAVAKVKVVAKKEKPAPKKAAVKATPKIVAKKEKPVKAKPAKAAPKVKVADKQDKKDSFASFTSKLSSAGALPKNEKPAPKKAVAKKKPAPKKAVAKKKPAVKAAAKAKPKTKVVVKAKPKVKVVNKLAKKVVVKKVNVANKLAKKSNNFDSNIANNLVKRKKKKNVLTPFALKKEVPAKKKPTVTVVNEEVLNPITFGLKVIQSKEGQEAAGVLIGGGLKLVSATLQEGKTAKVSVPRGLDAKTGEIKTEVVSVGLKELLDGGIFAGKEALQVAGSAYNKAYRGYSEPRNGAKKSSAKISPAGEGVLNPLTFGLKVVQSQEAQAALPELIDGGLKLVQATLEEGKRSKVSVPRRIDSRTGQVTSKVVNVGPGELLQAGLFAGGEIFGAGKSVFDRLYVTGEGAGDGADDKASAAARVAIKSKVSTIAARVDSKTGKLIAREKETYTVNVGGKNVRVVRNSGGLFN